MLGWIAGKMARIVFALFLCCCSPAVWAGGNWTSGSRRHRRYVNVGLTDLTGACPCPLGQPPLNIPCDARFPNCPPQSYCFATNTVDIGPYVCCPVWSTVGARYQYRPGVGGQYCPPGTSGAVLLPRVRRWPSYWPKKSQRRYAHWYDKAKAAAKKAKKKQVRVKTKNKWDEENELR